MRVTIRPKAIILTNSCRAAVSRPKGGLRPD